MTRRTLPYPFFVTKEEEVINVEKIVAIRDTDGTFSGRSAYLEGQFYDPADGGYAYPLSVELNEDDETRLLKFIKTRTA